MKSRGEGRRLSGNVASTYAMNLSDDQDACDGCVTNECTGGAAVAANASPMTSTRKAAADDPVDACHEAAKAYCNDGRDSCHVCQAWGT